MAFVRKKTKVYPWPVEVKRPSEDIPGEFEKFEFKGKFVRLTRTELDKFEEEDEFSALVKILFVCHPKPSIWQHQLVSRLSISIKTSECF